MTVNIPVVDVGVLDADGGLAPFKLTFYGVPFQEFMAIPGGSNRIQEALKRRGLHGYTSSPFLINARTYGRATPRPPAPKPEPPLAPDPIERAVLNPRTAFGKRTWG